MPNIKNGNEFTYNKVKAPTGRSIWRQPVENTLTMQEGDLVPIFWENVQPGDTWVIGLTYVLRMLTPIVPVLDNASIDFAAFFVPNRILTQNYQLTEQNGEPGGDWETLCGENKDGYWAPETTTTLIEYTLPYLNSIIVDNGGDAANKETDILPQSVADYLDLPIGITNNSKFKVPEIYNIKTDITTQYKLIANNLTTFGLPFAAMDYIWNYWYRDENTQAPTTLLQNHALNEVQNKYNQLSGRFGITDGIMADYGDGEGTTTKKYPYKVAKFHDLFTGLALPEPNKGDIIELSLGVDAPIDAQTKLYWRDSGNTTKNGNGERIIGTTTQTSNLTLNNTTEAQENTLMVGDYYNTYIGAETTGTADLTQATAITIQDLRNAFALQHLEETMARGGTRYDEFLMSIFGVAPSKYELGRPEYLGGSRQPINISQVVQSAQTTSGDLGELGAFSHTFGQDSTIVSKSFKEHGILMIFAYIRTDKKYYQGIPRKWSKYQLTDFYIPELQGIGDQEVKIQELYAYADANMSDIFGYVPRYQEYKSQYNKLHGNINPMAMDETLKHWTFQIPFESEPHLSSEFIEEGSEGIANTLYDQTTLTQFLADFYINITTTRKMSLYNIPGLDRM